jgi:hypothetical protein
MLNRRSACRPFPPTSTSQHRDATARLYFESAQLHPSPGQSGHPRLRHGCVVLAPSAAAEPFCCFLRAAKRMDSDRRSGHVCTPRMTGRLPDGNYFARSAIAVACSPASAWPVWMLPDTSSGRAISCRDLHMWFAVLFALEAIPLAHRLSSSCRPMPSASNVRAAIADAVAHD